MYNRPTDVAAITPNCSFPFTYNGGLYYRCIENMANVSSVDQPFACIDDNATAVTCNSPGASLIITISNAHLTPGPSTPPSSPFLYLSLSLPLPLPSSLSISALSRAPQIFPSTFPPFPFPPFPPFPSHSLSPFSSLSPNSGEALRSPSRKLNLVHFKWKIWHLVRIILLTFVKNYIDFHCLWQNIPHKLFWSICSDVYAV